MKEIKKCALIGAGAIGGFFIRGMCESGTKLLVIAEGARAERLKANGVKVNGTVYRPEVCTAEEAGEQDLILIAVKYNALDEAIEQAARMTGTDTLVLSTLNGIDSEERVAQAIGREHVLHSLMHIASRRYPDRIEVQTAESQGILFGNVWLPEPQGSEAVKAVDAFFTQAGIEHRLPDSILYAQWHKYASNVAYNLPQAAVGCGNGIYTDSEHARFLCLKLWAEAAALAKTYGVTLPDTTQPWQVAKSSRFSTLQDLDAGRPTEIAMFAGVLAGKSREAGLSAPYAEYTYHLIRLLEEKNTGRFDYKD